MFCVWHWFAASIQKSGAHINGFGCFCHFEAKRINCLDLRKNCVCVYVQRYIFGFDCFSFSPVQVGLLPLGLVVSVRVLN